MGLFDEVLGQVAGGAQVGQLAGRLGLNEAQVQQAIVALTQAHPQPGDTVQGAAATTGLPQGTLAQLLEHLGGEGVLARLAPMLAGAGASGASPGGPGGMLGGLGGLFGQS